LVVALQGLLPAQSVSEEYRVKAAFLYNFLKYVQWPADAATGPLVICVAGRNPFGTVLEDLVRGEVVDERRVEARVILEPEPGCHLLFVPDGAAIPVYLRAASGQPVFTVGESRAFMNQGG